MMGFEGNAGANLFTFFTSQVRSLNRGCSMKSCQRSCMWNDPIGMFQRVMFTVAVTIVMIFFASIAPAAVITLTEDFEGVSAPSIPAGWQAIGSGITTDANGNPGNNLQVAAGTARYLVNTGGGFDATQDFSGAFDFWLDDATNYSNIAFVVGDVQDGLTRTSGGEFLQVDLRERTFGARANILDGAGTTLFNGTGDNTYQIEDNQWYTASFSWTAATGTFSISWTGAQGNKGPMTVSGYAFDDDEVFFGFGTFQHAARFDNISLTGSTVAVPEPASFSLLGVAAFVAASLPWFRKETSWR